MTATDTLQTAIERLAAIDRTSCSPGERAAAESIARALRERGARAHLEHERVHGTYWWPLGVTAALGIAGAAAARRGWRLCGGLLAGAAAATVIDDLGAGRRWLRRLLPQQTTANVVAQTGDSRGTRTLLVVAHHDAAHTSVFFSPRFSRIVIGRGRSRSGGPARLPPVMLPIPAAPALVAAGALTGARRVTAVGAAVCAGIIASLCEIAVRATVPGANDNLTGVATLLALADALATRPVAGLRVLLISTGAEEALMDGMWAFARRHFAALPRETTRLLCVDAVGSPHLVLAEAEGMLQVHDYDPALKALVAECAAEAGVALRRGMRMRLGTDGYLALRHGVPAAMLTSVDAHGTASNYHQPTDTPDRVDYATLSDAVRLCERVVRRLADGACLKA